jgi:xanthine dehydrogenase accessory factor
VKVWEFQGEHMFDEFLKKSMELTAKGEIFAVATVVRCQAPSSGKQGDRAIVHADGQITGWIGGGCAQPVVAKEALKAMKDGKPRMVRISPSSGLDGSGEGVVDYTMTCHSGGALDIYIEPVLPRTQLVILGRSPVAVTLARLSQVLGYRVVMVAERLQEEISTDVGLIEDKGFKLDSAKVTPESFVVVSTQGEGDEEALEQAMQSPASYVAFVASKTKAGKVFEFLRGRGIAQSRLEQVHAPAGLNIAATSPEEIAVSILAEIIKVRHSQPRTAAVVNKSSQILPVLNSEAKDPICGMMVDTAKARYKSQHEGKWEYFCCAGCKDAFDREHGLTPTTEARRHGENKARTKD